jgi:hypothetical protein
MFKTMPGAAWRHAGRMDVQLRGSVCRSARRPVGWLTLKKHEAYGTYGTYGTYETYGTI